MFDEPCDGVGRRWIDMKLHVIASVHDVFDWVAVAVLGCWLSGEVGLLFVCMGYCVELLVNFLF